MKHLRSIALEAQTLSLADPLVASHSAVAMEGMVDSVVASYKSIKDAVKSKFSSSDLPKKDADIATIKKTLHFLKTQVSQSKLTETQLTAVGQALSKFNLGAKDSEDLLKKLKDERNALDTLLNETVAAAQSGGKEKIKDKTALKPNTEESAKKMQFTKGQVLNLIDLGIGYCDTYEKARKKHDQLSKMVPAQEAEAGAGFLDMIWNVILSVLKFILTIWLLVLIIMNPVVGLLTILAGGLIIKAYQQIKDTSSDR